MIGELGHSLQPPRAAGSWAECKLIAIKTHAPRNTFPFVRELIPHFCVTLQDTPGTTQKHFSTSPGMTCPAPFLLFLASFERVVGFYGKRGKM